MPRTEEQNKEILDKRKEEILQAALEEFSRKGYSGTKISDIVKRAHISQGLIYHYYKSKNELYLAVVKRSIELSKKVMEMVQENNLCGWNGIVAMTDGMLKWLKSGGEGKIRFFFMEQAAILEPMPEGVKEELSKSMAVTEFTSELIKQGQKEGIVIEGNPQRLAIMYWSVMQGIIMSELYRENIFKDSYDVVPEIDMILAILKK